MVPDGDVPTAPAATDRRAIRLRGVLTTDQFHALERELIRLPLDVVGVRFGGRDRLTVSIRPQKSPGDCWAKLVAVAQAFGLSLERVS